jgi:predicted aspartyl protease
LSKNIGNMTDNIETWLNQIAENPKQYEGKFVIHDGKNLLFVSPTVKEADDWRKSQQVQYAMPLRLFLVPYHFGSVRLRMLKIKSLSAGEWTPTYPVKFVLDDGSHFELDMLVDSGADITFIPKAIGEQLGLTRSRHETTFTAYGVGSELSYLVREMPIKIDDTELTIRLLWGQDEGVADILLGRLDVFDHFDVLFSQKNKQVRFIPPITPL